MCECGCTANDRRYTFPAPGRTAYLLTLSGGCVECDAPSGVSIERISMSDMIWKQREEFTDGALKFEKWSDSEGVAIITGLRKHEFVKALLPQLVGVSAEDMGEGGVIDESGAEVILEEMYEDAQVRPHFPPNPGAIP